jgi:hypothetical protein
MKINDQPKAHMHAVEDIAGVGSTVLSSIDSEVLLAVNLRGINNANMRHIALAANAYSKLGNFGSRMRHEGTN